MSEHRLGNAEVAILMRVNELAERYGLKPYDFGAEVRCDVEEDKTILMFGWTPDANTREGTQFFQMVDRIGVGKTTGILEGTDKEIINALDSALQRAPKRRSRA
jgi:hypothetical protein